MKQRIFSAHPSVNRQNQKHKRFRTTTQYSQGNLRDTQQGSKGKDRSSFLRKPHNFSRSFAKEPEQILEENLNLKTFINSLQDQLAIQRSRLEVSRRKNEKVSKQINREFQKEIYYSGKNPSSYLISGVKGQYENIKNLYEQKCNDFESVIRTIENTSLEEMRVYIDVLEKQNASLAEQIKTFRNLKNSYSEPYSQGFQASSNPRSLISNNRSSGKIYTEVEEGSEKSYKNMDVLIYELTEERNYLNRAKSIIEKYSQKLDIVIKEKEEQAKKIQFLEKLLIEKDNNEHQSRRDLKKVQRQKNSSEIELSRLAEVMADKEVEFKNKLQNLQQREAKKYDIERQIFNKSLQQKNEYITKLQKEIRSLSAMLCYWKPLDEPDDDLSREQNLESSPKSRDNKEMGLEKVIQNRVKMQSEHLGKESAFSDHSYLENIGRNDTEIDRSVLMEQSVFKRTLTGNRSSAEEALVHSKEKPRRECSRKYSQGAKKTRKINLNEIKELGQLIRYRLIGHRISIEKVKQLFDERMPTKGAEDEYINMKTIKDILTKHPFSLSEPQATLVSRYVVEDSANQYVYCDELNEISINIAKSIVKAFIGQYQLPDMKQTMEEWNKLKSTYLVNLMTALRMLAPKGAISLEKFTQLLIGLGIEMHQQLEDWLIGQIVIVSPTLEELKYEIIEKL